MSQLDFLAWNNYRLGITLAIDCLALCEKALRLGLMDLQQDMEVAEPYDHDKPKGDYEKNYNKKNEYFNRANMIGMPFLERGITGISKMYYREMLNAINDYEKKNNKPLNKGMVCGNLGVSALAEGDFDGGIAYLLWAGQEDRWWSGDPTKNIFANPLYTQFAKGTHRQGKSQFGELAPWIMMKTAIDKYNTEFKDSVNIDDVFKELEGSQEHRALLEGSLWVIHRNLVLLKEEKERGIYSNKNNIYTRLRLFDGLVGLCRFIELRMRYYEKISGKLKDLLIAIFGKETWFKNNVSPRNKSPQKPKDFDDRMREALEKVNRPGKSVLILWTLRNYATHICDPEAPFFFENIENIFNELVIAYIYYLKFKKLI
jgi:hypothetical protein